MSSLAWTKFFWADWESDPALRLCSFAAQGLWMRMLCIAAAHDPIGYVAVAGRALDTTALARMTGGSEGEVQILLAELDRNGVFSRDRHSRIYSRRMVRDARKSAEARKNGRKGGNPTLCSGTGKVEVVNPQDNGWDKPQKPEAKKPDRASKDKSSEADARGVRLAENWLPSPADVAYAAKEGFSALEIQRIADGFHDYWRSKAGAGARKTDWSATWRGWVRREAERQAASPRPPLRRVGFV